MRTWRGYFISGVVLGGVLVIIGIYTESMPIRFTGIALPLVGIGLGLVLGRDRRTHHDDH